MKLNEIIEKLDLKTVTNLENNDVEGVFISDMVSDVMSSAKTGDVWLTIQTHDKIVAASNLLDLPAIIITGGKEVPPKTIELANRFHVVILSTPMNTFQTASKLVEIGIKS